jgi:hypothetical protein
MFTLWDELHKYMKRYFNCSKALPCVAGTNFTYAKLIHTTSTSPALHPWFITGFVDAEGCFMITVRKQQGSTG